MDLDVARDMAGAGQEAGVVPAGRVELGGHGRDVDVLPDLDRGADGQPVAGQGHAHRGLEGAEVGVEVVPLVADQHELAGLVGGDQERRAELPQQRGKFGVWTARSGVGSSILGRSGSSVGLARELGVAITATIDAKELTRATRRGIAWVELAKLPRDHSGSHWIR